MFTQLKFKKQLIVQKSIVLYEPFLGATLVCTMYALSHMKPLMK